MVQWFIIILAYDLAILKLSLSEVTLSLRLLHYKNRNGLTYENRPCDSRIENDLNRDGRCDTAFLFCLVRLPFQNPHNCTLGDHFTGFVGGDDIHFINVHNEQLDVQQRSSSLISLWFQPIIFFRFQYPKTGVGLIVEVFDVDDPDNHTIHDSIDFYGRTLLDLKIYSSEQTAQAQRVYLRSLFGTYTNLTVDFSLYCSENYYGKDCEMFCLPNEQRYDCDLNTGQKLCKPGYFGQDCFDDTRACADQPCLNNGTCIEYYRGYLCRCQRGYTGQSCEIGPVIQTTNLRCDRMNCIHGDCSINERCICHDGWTSENCNQSLIIRQSGCASRPCLHNSTCETLVGINPASAYRCHCRSGYTGRHCEVAIITSCERIPCIYGRCSKSNFYTEICICDDGWNGIDCSEKVPLPTTQSIITNTNLTQHGREDYLKWLNTNYGIGHIPNQYPPSSATPFIPNRYKYTPCLSAPCLHNSTCVVQSEHHFQCICAPSFIGIFCEIEILRLSHFQSNPCASSPCQHQGVCVTKSNQNIQCICRPYYTGKFCEYPVPFRLPVSNRKCNRKCYNGGICLIDEFNREQCICKTSFAGLSCEFAKKNCSTKSDPLCNLDPCLSNPCLSNGTCHVLLSSKNYSCSCSEHYGGDRCEFDLTMNSQRNFVSNTSTTDLWPLAIVFGYIFSLMYGLTIRQQTSLTYGECVSDPYQPYRLSVSNPIFHTNQEYSTPISKTCATPPTTISNLDQWTRTINH